MYSYHRQRMQVLNTNILSNIHPSITYHTAPSAPSLIYPHQTADPACSAACSNAASLSPVRSRSTPAPGTMALSVLARSRLRACWSARRSWLGPCRGIAGAHLVSVCDAPARGGFGCYGGLGGAAFEGARGVPPGPLRVHGGCLRTFWLWVGVSVKDLTRKRI